MADAYGIPDLMGDGGAHISPGSAAPDLKTVLRTLAARLHQSAADSAAVEAIAAQDRGDWMILIKEDSGQLWYFNPDSSAVASASVLVPDDAPVTGRWLVLGDPDLASLATSAGAGLIGLLDTAARIAAATVEAALAELAARNLGTFASEAAIKAIPAAARTNGSEVVDATNDVPWFFDSGSSAGADAWTLVPDAGTGRWLRKNPSLADLSSTSATLGAALIGYDGGTTVKAALDTILSTGLAVASKTVGFADLVALGAVQQGSIDFDAALPAGAMVVGYGKHVTAIFDNAGDTASGTSDLGIKSGDTDVWIDGGSLNAVAKVSTPSGTGASLVGAVTPSIVFDFDVNFDTLAKGAATYYVVYTEPF